MNLVFYCLRALISLMDIAFHTSICHVYDHYFDRNMHGKAGT